MLNQIHELIVFTVGLNQAKLCQIEHLGPNLMHLISFFLPNRERKCGQGQTCEVCPRRRLCLCHARLSPLLIHVLVDPSAPASAVIPAANIHAIQVHESVRALLQLLCSSTLRLCSCFHAPEEEDDAHAVQLG